MSELLGRAKAVLDGVTPGPWDHRIAPHDDEKASHADWLAGTLVGGESLHVLIAASPEPRYSYIVPAVTGDGPTSAKNAEFIAAARDLVPELAEALHEAYVVIAELHEQIADLERIANV